MIECVRALIDFIRSQQEGVLFCPPKKKIAKFFYVPNYHVTSGPRSTMTFSSLKHIKGRLY